MVPFFSVIVSTYNRANQLPEVIDSILKQTFGNIEIIIVDDCSTDETKAALRQFKDSRLLLLETQQNTGGPAKPRNIGIHHAKGKWLSFCDSDDCFTIDHLQRIYDFIEEKGLDDGMISTNAYLTIDGKRTDTVFFKTDTGNSYKKYQLIDHFKTNKVILSSLIIRNKDLVAFEESPSYRSIEDYFFVLENLKAGKPHFYLEGANIYYSHNSADSIRELYGYGNILAKYKLGFFRKYVLWKDKHAFQFIKILLVDNFKMIGREVIKMAKFFYK